MLGRRNPQGSLLEAGRMFGHLVTKGSFYEKLAAHGHEIVTDDDLAHMYSSGRGRPSIPPSVMMRALLLQIKDDVSDREASRRSRVDLDWKAALGIDGDHPGIGATTLSLMRARIVLHDADQAVFKKTVQRAVQAGVFPKRTVALIDSSPVLGAGAVQDTYELLRAAIRKVVAAAREDNLPNRLLRKLARYTSEHKPPIDWADAAARKKELARMVEVSRLLLDAVRDRDEAAEAARLLGAIVAQDVEIDEDTGEPRIRQGTAKDRIVSASDPEMRHGRKSSSRRFDGHKLHVLEDESTEIILSADVGAGNGADNEHAVPLLEEATEAGVEVDELVGDTAYGDGDTRAAIESYGAKMIAKVPATTNGGLFAKTDFLIDPELLQATCPAGEVATDWHPNKDHRGRDTVRLVFPVEACATCPVRSDCVRGRGSRTITLGGHEARMARARVEQRRPSVKAKLRRRAVIERKIDHLHDLGARKARYRGRRKTKLQVLLAATVANFSRLETLGCVGAANADEDGQSSLNNRLPGAMQRRHRPQRRSWAALKAIIRPIRRGLTAAPGRLSDPLCCSLT